MSIGGVNNANKRLIEMGFIEKVRHASANYASIYSLVQTYTLLHSGDVKECISTHNHDVFRYQGLGKSGCEIWQAIQDGPKTIQEIEKITGRHRTTIKRKLDKMSNIIDIRTGEIISMVLLDGERYQAQEDINLDYIAELLGTKGKGEVQKRQHIREREEHNRQITRITHKTTDNA
jgi:predicted transcriptional regulator